MSDDFDPYYVWLGIPPKDQPPNHYRLLGVDRFEANLDVIESAAFRQMGHVRTYQGGNHAAESQRLLNELSAAKICLLNPGQKESYDQQLRASVEAASAVLPDAVLPDAVLPDAVLPDAVLPDAVLPDTILPDAIVPDEPIEGALPSPVPTAGAELVHALEVVPESGSSDSSTAKPAAAVSARRSRPRPKSQIPLVIGVVVVIACLGIVIMFGAMFLGQDERVTRRDPQLRTSPRGGTTPQNSPGQVKPTVTETMPGIPPGMQPGIPPGMQPGVGFGPNGVVPNNIPPSAMRQPVTALNEATRSIRTVSDAMRQRQLQELLASPFRSMIERAAGIASDKFVFAQTMAYNELIVLVQQLRHLGYRPLRLRPYSVNGQSHVASVWTRDAIDWRIAIGVDAATIRQADQSLRQRGFRPVDVACWQADTTRFAAVWVAASAASEQHELMLDVAGDDFAAAAAGARARGLMPRSHSIYYDSRGRRRDNAVWHKPDEATSWRFSDDDHESSQSTLGRLGVPQDIYLGYQASGDLKYGAVLVGMPDPDTKDLRGSTADDHHLQCQKLVAQGFQPMAIAAAARPTGPQIAVASVWRRSRGSVAPADATASADPPSSAATANATQALRFDGDDLVSVSNTSELASRKQAFTAEMWFRCTEPAIVKSYVLMGITAPPEPTPSNLTSAGTISGWHVTVGQIRNFPNRHAFSLQTANMSSAAQGNEVAIPALGNGWHHLAVCSTPRGSLAQLALYFDGQRIHLLSQVLRDGVYGAGDVYLGLAENVPNQDAFLGDIKAFRLSSKALYQNSFTPPRAFTADSSTLVLLDFDGSSSSQLNDLSGHKRHAAIRGAKWISVDAPATSVVASVPATGQPPTETGLPEPAAPERERLPVPSKQDRTAGSARVKEIFAAELGAANDKPKKRELALDFLSRGENEEDAVAKFALLYESRELALEAIDVDMAMKTTEELSTCYEVDPWILRCDALTKLANSTRSDAERRQIVNTSLLLTDEAMGNSDWKSATTLVAAALKVYGRLKDRDILRVVSQKKKQVEAYKKLSEEAERAAATLANSPDDGPANVKLGRYHCFVKNEWDEGLPYLAKGSDEELAKLAVLDTQKPDGDDALSLANGWFAWSEKAPEADKTGGLMRAKHWYSVALPNLSGLDRTVAMKKLDELDKEVGSISATRKLSWLNGAAGELKRLEGHTSEVTSLDIDRAGTTLVSGSSDNTVRIWDLAKGQEKGQIKSSVGRIVKVALIRDDQFVLVIGSRSTAEVWNVRTGKPATALTVPTSIRDAELSADDKILVCARSSSSSGNISIYKMSTGAVVGQLDSPSSPYCVAISPTGRLIGAACGDRKVYVWNLATKKIAAPFTGLGSTPSDVAISPDERLVAACAANRVIVWELANGKTVSESPNTGGTMYKVKFSPDSRRLLCAGMMNEISVLDVQTGSIIQKLTGATRGASSYARAMDFLPDPRGAVSAGYDGIIRVWRLPD